METAIWDKTKQMFQRMGILPIAIIVMGLFIQINNPNFLTGENLTNILRQISILTVLSFGMTAIIISGHIDLSVGSIVGLSCVIGSTIMKSADSITIGIVVAVVIGIITGAINGILKVVSDIHSFVITLGMLSVYRGIALIYTNGLIVPDLPPSFIAIGSGDFFGLPILIWVTFAVFLVMWFVINKTRFGLYLYEIGGRKEAAILSGINVNRSIIMVFALSGALAGISGMMLTSRVISAHATLGAGYHLQAIAAVVIGGSSLGGGKGTIGGTVLGILVLGVLSNGLNLLRVSTFWQNVAIGATIVVAVILDGISRMRQQREVR